MTIDNISSRELMEILNHLFDEFGSVDRGMVLGSLAMYFRMHNKEQETLTEPQEATTEPQTAQSNNSTTNSTKSLDEPVRAKKAPHPHPVVIDGIVYESAKTACIRHGIKPSAIYQATYRKGMTAEQAITRYLEKHKECKRV